METWKEGGAATPEGWWAAPDRWPLHNSLWVRAGLRTHAYQADQITELLKHRMGFFLFKNGGRDGEVLADRPDLAVCKGCPPLMQAQDCQICLPALTPKPRHPECVKFSDLIVLCCKYVQPVDHHFAFCTILIDGL